MTATPFTNKDKINTLDTNELGRFMLYDLPRVLNTLEKTEAAFTRWLNLPYNWEAFMVSRYSEYREHAAKLGDVDDRDIKIYDPSIIHINTDLADRCNHGR